MERIDRQQRINKATGHGAGESQHDAPRDADGAETASQWLGSAMAMWLDQNDAQARADREGRHADTNPR